MAEWSGFFDAHKVGESWDRVYLAEDFAKFFSPLIGNGVFAGRSNALQVFQSVPAGMSVTVSSGQSWIDGYGYLNDSDLTVFVDPADGALGRIDRIVNQWSAVDRQIRTVWKKGTPAVNPVAPPLQWDADYKELNLCTLNITAGLSAITQDKIRDTRADSSVCGWVTGLIDQVDTSTLFAQWESAYEKEFTEQKRAWENFFKDIQLDLGIPVPSPDKANYVLAVASNGGYTLSDEYDIRSLYNYVHNSDCTQWVAQAGIGGKHGTQSYAGDRWILDSGTLTGTAREDGNGYTNIMLNGTIRQRVANAPDVGTVFVEMISGTATASYQNGEVTITSYGGVIRGVLLLAGNHKNSPKYRSKGYAAELAECQRYFLTVSGDPLGVGYCAYGSLLLQIPTPVPMRIKPSLPETYINIPGINGSAMVLRVPSGNISVSSLCGNSVVLELASESIPSVGVYACFVNDTYSLSADL